MPVGTTWNRLSPAGSDNPANGAQEIADLKKMVDERTRNGGHFWEPDGDARNANTGRHVCGAEQQSGGTGAAANEFYVYADTAPSGTLKDFIFKDRSHASPGVDFQTGVTGSVTKVRKLQVTTDGLQVDAGAITLPAGSLETADLADAAVTSDKIGSAAVLRSKLVSKAATANTFAQAAGVLGPISGETSILSTTFTTGKSPGNVHCHYSFLIIGGAATPITLKFKRDGGDLQNFTWTLDQTGPYGFSFVDTGLAPDTTYTYDLTLTQNGLSVRERVLTILELAS